MTHIRKYLIAKYVVAHGVVAMLWQVFFPTVAFALTAGPSQPEQQGFMPINVSEMVDPFTGKFSYNIPLMEVPGPEGGYPINLFYGGPPTTDQEASMVGLGWNLNLGNISRSLQGLPDDFKGDIIEESNYIKPDKTIGFSVSTGNGSELCGLPFSTGGGGGNLSFNLGMSFGAFYNTYRGYGINTTVSPSLSFGSGIFGANAGVQLSQNSQTGVGINASASLSTNLSGAQFGLNGGMGVSSREGLTHTSLGISVDMQLKSNHGIGKINGSNYSLGSGGLGISATKIRYYSNQFSSPVATSMMSSNIMLGIIPGQAKFPLIFSPFSVGIISLGAIRGYSQDNWIGEEDVQYPAYGYIYSEASPKGIGVMDFHRHNDRLITKESRNLPVPRFNNDFFQIQGHGVGGTFRAYRSEHGVLHDREISSTSTGVNGDLELGFGVPPPLKIHVGLNVYTPTGGTTTGPWDDGTVVGEEDLDDFSEYHSFTGSPSAGGDPLYEPYYFKMQGEMTADGDFSPSMERPEKVEIAQDGKYKDKAKKFIAVDNMGYTKSGYSPNFFKERSERKKRNTLISSLTKAEAEEVGISRYLYSEGHAFIGHQANDHMAEYTVTNPSGMRYIYGFPVYNTVHREVTFAYDGNVDPYGPNYHTDDDYPSKAQKRNGVNDEYFKSVSMPPYAHDYLLNAIVGTDYIDVDPVNSPGPSDDDLGYWVKMDYSTDVDYQWRAPYDRATYMPGARNNTEGEIADDKGHYVYGRKDLSYPNEVETKTHKALFYYDEGGPREDAKEAAGETPVADDKGLMSMRRLSRIELVSKVDETKPLMTVHFEHDYSLCPETSNSNHNGKLTLKKLWFTYLDTEKGELTPYEFTYHVASNYDYDETAYDHWGYYKPPFDLVNYSPLGSSSPHLNNNNLDFPFVDQTTPKATMDEYMSAWALKEIHLPSGATIELTLEAADYSLVQDRKAAQLVQITGIGTNGNNEIGHNDNGILANEERLFIQLHESMSDVEFFDQYLDGLDKIYFKVFMKLNGDNGSKKYPVGFNGSDVYDFVAGYCDLDIDPTGAWYGTTGDKGWVNIRTIDLADNKPEQVHPFSSASWQYTRLSRPNLAFNPVKNLNSPLLAIGSLIGAMFQEFPSLFTNYNVSAMKRKGGQFLNLGKSFVRLNAPHHYNSPTHPTDPGGFIHSKYGGGSRVKQIVIKANWENGGTTENIEYGQQFEYTTTDADGNTISSGVAENEPGMDSGENPLKVYRGGVEVRRPWTGVSNNLFTELPVMTPYYPAPRIGYKRVKVSSIGTPAADKNKMGSTVYTFYTADRFPVREYDTPITVREAHNPTITLPLFGSRQRSEMVMSQGYSIVLNDMHGKPETVTTYAESAVDEGDFISQTRYTYHTDGNDAKKLNNQVTVLTGDGITESAYVGRDFEQFTAMRQTHTLASSDGEDYNLDLMFFPPFILIPCFSLFPKLDRSVTALRTVENVKIIQEYGLVKSVEATYMGSHTTTENILFDAETGIPRLTSTTNAFDDPVFTYNYAAHWSYPGMESGYKNVGYVHEVDATDLTSSTDRWIFDVTPLEATFFTPGDELLITDGSGKLLTVAEVVETTSGSGLWQVKCFKDASGVGGSFNMKIVRSGHRNMQSINSGSIVHLSNQASTFPLNTWVMITLWNQVFQENNDFTTNKVFTIPNTDPDYQTIFSALAIIYGFTPLEVVVEYFPNPGVGTQQLFFRIGGTSVGTLACQFEFDGDFNNLVNSNMWSFSHPGNIASIWEFNDGVTTTNVSTSGISKCEDFQLTDPLVNMGDILHADASTFSDEWTLDFHDGNRGALADAVGTNIYNPYQSGERGIFRAKETYAYKESRDQVSLDLTVNDHELAKKGVYESFTPFVWDGSIPNVANWIYSNSISKVSPYGYELENTNALNIPSSALYGYDHTLPIMTAANAGYYEIANANFEDVLGFETDNSGGTYDNHFGHFQILDLTKVSDDDAYTGDYSLKVESSGMILDTEINGNELLDLTDEQDYLISMWVKESGQYKPENIVVNIHANNSSSNWCPANVVTSLVASGPSIEGWQKYEAKLDGKPQSNLFGCTWDGTIEIEVNLSLGSGTAYIDDVRFIPYDSQVSTYVYDPLTKRYISTLDDNNLAARYYYDAEGKLTHVMKDTEEGTRLLQENNNHTAY